MDSTPLISVVVATYNGARFIGAQLDSILQQTYPNLEVIVVDDRSTDDTASILYTYATQHANIKVFINEENLGYVKNFEKGMLLAKGDFIAPSDQDDIWLPEKLSILMRERGDHVIVYCNSELINDENQKIGKKLSDIKRLINFKDPIMFAIGNSAPGHGMLIPKQMIVDAIPFPTMVPHDHWLGLVATFQQGLVYVDEPLVLYRQHQANVFGAVKVHAQKKAKRKSESKKEQYAKIRERVFLMYEKCPERLGYQKQFFFNLYKTYRNFSLINNMRRSILFFKHRDLILSFKRRTAFRKILFSIKTFWTIQ